MSVGLAISSLAVEKEVALRSLRSPAELSYFPGPNNFKDMELMAKVDGPMAEMLKRMFGKKD